MDSRGGAGGAPDDPPPSRRFESWKEIAVYFGRDVRTVRRWERHEALPVHRHLHRARGSVYAFQAELDRWLARRAMPASVNPSDAAAASSTAGLPPRFSPGSLVVLAGMAVLTGVFVYALAVNGRIPGGSRAGEATETGSSDRRLADEVRDVQVRERFLVAKHQLQRRGGHREEAREQLESVVSLAPEFAEAHALLGEAYLRGALFDPLTRATAWPKAEAAVRRALAIDANDATAHTVLGRILLLRDWNWADAGKELRRALALDPDSADTRSAYAVYLRAAGRSAEAIAERERARRTDPLNPQLLVALGDEYTFAGQYSDAIETYQRVLELERDHRGAIAGLADVYPRLGRYVEGAFWHSRRLALLGQSEVAAAFDDVRRRGGPVEAIAWLDRRTLAEFERAPGEHLWDLAYLHARLGHRDAAFEFLERAYEGRDAGLLQARVDPDLDSLRGDPRFVELLKRIGPP